MFKFKSVSKDPIFSNTPCCFFTEIDVIPNYFSSSTKGRRMRLGGVVSWQYEAIWLRCNKKWQPVFRWLAHWCLKIKNLVLMMANSWQLTKRSKIQTFWSSLLLIPLSERFILSSFCFPKVSVSGKPNLHFSWPEGVVWSLVTYCLMNDVMVSGMYKDGVSDLKLSKAWFVF